MKISSCMFGNKMVSVFNTHVRSFEKLLEDGELSGKLELSNQKMRDIHFGSFDLTDVTFVDLSHNGVQEIPVELSDWFCIKSLNLSYNAIKMIPDFVVNFRLMQLLDLSNNAIENIPPSICSISCLRILRIKNNRLLALPQEIGQLKHCQELDVSNNRLQCLPNEMSGMSMLFSLNVSMNMIENLPEVLSALPLVQFDAHCNKLSEIPLSFQSLTNLETFDVSENPITFPSFETLKMGLVHVLKSLQDRSIKIQRNMNQQASFLSSRHQNSLESIVKNISASPQRNLTAGIPLIQNDGITTPLDNDNPSEGVIKDTHDCASSLNEAELQPEEVLKDFDDVCNNNYIDNITTSLDENDGAVERATQGTQYDDTKSISQSVLQKKTNIPRLRSSSSPKSQVRTSGPKQSIRARSSTNYPGYSPPKHPAGSPQHAQFLKVLKVRKAHNLQTSRKVPTGKQDPSFTLRRKTEKLYEELELMEKLKENIESQLKMPLPQDIMPALSDGVVLCHLVNHLKPRTIPTIHVPSPAVPKLSLAKSRRNVENFIEACHKFNIAGRKICSSNDIMHEKGLQHVADTVAELVKLNPTKKSTSASVKVTH